MANSLNGYGAIPPMPNGIVGPVGMPGPPGNSMFYNTINSAFEIKGSESVLTISLDGMVKTKAGSIHVDDWIIVTNLMKQLVIDMSKDENLASKYPYIRETAHRWLIDELRK